MATYKVAVIAFAAQTYHSRLSISTEQNSGYPQITPLVYQLQAMQKGTCPNPITTRPIRSTHLRSVGPGAKSAGHNCCSAWEATMLTTKSSSLCRRNRRLARQKWGLERNHSLLAALKSDTKDLALSVSAGDVILLQGNWYAPMPACSASPNAIAVQE